MARGLERPTHLFGHPTNNVLCHVVKPGDQLEQRGVLLIERMPKVLWGKLFQLLDPGECYNWGHHNHYIQKKYTNDPKINPTERARGELLTRLPLRMPRGSEEGERESDLDDVAEIAICRYAAAGALLPRSLGAMETRCASLDPEATKFASMARLFEIGQKMCRHAI